MKLSAFFEVSICVLGLASLLQGCAAVKKDPATALPTGNFIGAIGALTASTGSCPTTGVASGWCTGGTFASGSTDGAFSATRAVAVDGFHGYVYAANGHKIDKINLSTGAYVGSIGALTGSTGTCPTSGVASGWCTGGTFTNAGTDGAFYVVRTLAVDSTNNFLYVTDNSNHRIVKINLTTGAFIGAIGKTTASTGSCPVGVATVWCTGGTFTNAGVDGAFYNPVGLAIDVAGDRMYVSERNNSRVNKFVLSTGAFVGAIGKTNASTGNCPVGVATGWCTGGTFVTGAGDGVFNFAWAVAVDPTNDLLYVTDGNNKISKITLSTGAFIGAVGSVTATTGTCTVGIASSWCTGGTFAAGAVDGAYNTAQAISIDPAAGFLYLADQTNNRVVKLSTSGAFVGALGNTTASSGTCPSSGAAPTYCTGGTFAAGAGDGMFNLIYSLAVDPLSNALIAGDSSGANSRFVKLVK